MLCHTVHNVYKNCLQDGVGTSPGATINSWKKKNYCGLIIVVVAMVVIVLVVMEMNISY